MAVQYVSGLMHIERTPRPTLGTMGLPPKFAVQWFAGRPTAPLNLCGYGIGTGLLYRVEKQFLDPRGTMFSWFPENIFLPTGDIAFVGSFLGARRVDFDRGDAGCADASFGFREAIVLFPKP